jgi:hypothetical protein
MALDLSPQLEPYPRRRWWSAAVLAVRNQFKLHAARRAEESAQAIQRDDRWRFVKVPWQIASVPKVFVRTAYAALRQNLYRPASVDDALLGIKPLHPSRFAATFRLVGFVSMCVPAFAGMYGVMLLTLSQPSPVQALCVAATGGAEFAVAAIIGRARTPYSGTGRREPLDAARAELAVLIAPAYDVRMISVASDLDAEHALRDLNTFAKRHKTRTLAESLFNRDSKTLSELSMWDASPPEAPFAIFITRIEGEKRDEVGPPQESVDQPRDFDLVPR